MTLTFLSLCRAIQLESTRHRVRHTVQAEVPMGLPHQLLTEVLEVNQEAPMVVMEFQVMEGNMGQGQVVPLVGLMGVMVDNRMGDLMQTMVLQVIMR